MPDRSDLTANPNAVRHGRVRRRIQGGMATMGLAVLVASLIETYAMVHGAMDLVMLIGALTVMMILFCGTITSAALSDLLAGGPRTWPALRGREAATATVRHCVDTLVAATRTGIQPRERRALQAAISETADILAELSGEPVWMTIERGSIVGVPETLAKRGLLLEENAPALLDVLAKDKGESLQWFDHVLRNTVPIMVAIARDFGLDAGTLAHPMRILPGQTRGGADSHTQMLLDQELAQKSATIRPRGQGDHWADNMAQTWVDQPFTSGKAAGMMADPCAGSNRIIASDKSRKALPVRRIDGVEGIGMDADGNLIDMEARTAAANPSARNAVKPPIQEGVRRLAAEWDALPATMPPTLISASADAAAGPDLDRVEDAWNTAREAATHESGEAATRRLETVDAVFAEACATLAAAISEGLAERARLAQDDLATQLRYVTAKHPRWSSPLDDAEAVHGA